MREAEGKGKKTGGGGGLCGGVDWRKKKNMPLLQENEPCVLEKKGRAGNGS